MTLDYSKFDHIEDSDEEKEPVKSVSSVQRAPERTRVNKQKETLEPIGLMNRLNICGTGAGPQQSPSGMPPGALPPELAAMANELGLFNPPSRSGGANSAASDRGAEPEAQQANPNEPQRLCVKADGRKKIHTTFPDGGEMVEEFDERTDVLLVRKTRKATTLGAAGEWIFEVGQAPEAAFDPSSDLMKASASNPVFVRKDTPEHFQWRIRNLPYPAEVYSVTIDHEKQQIVVRTSNKKYFKRIDVPDLRRLGLAMTDKMLSWKHQHNTLIISYSRPAEVTADEQKKLQLADKTAMKM